MILTHDQKLRFIQIHCVFLDIIWNSTGKHVVYSREKGQGHVGFYTHFEWWLLADRQKHREEGENVRNDLHWDQDYVDKTAFYLFSMASLTFEEGKKFDGVFELTLELTFK